MKNLMVNKAETKLIKIPTTISSLKNKPVSLYKEIVSSVVAAMITGMDKSKEYFDASYRLYPLNKPTVITIPDLLVPGIIARVWAKPNTNASFKFKFSIILTTLSF